MPINVRVRGSILLPVLSLVGVSPTAFTPVAPSAPERLVAEATIRTESNGNTNVYLSVILHGQAATLLLGLGNDGDVILSSNTMNALHISPADPSLDSLTVGTVVEQHLTVQAGPDFSVLNQPDLPPVIGLLGNEILAHYDVVYDGPAHRVRLYARTPTVPALPTGARQSWLPPGMASARCTPLTPMPEHNAGFTIQADGHPITAIFETFSAYTKMNMVAARAVGLTQHSPNVHPLPADIWERQDGAGQTIKYQATDIHLTLGAQPFTDVPINLFPALGIDSEESPVPPTILLTNANLRRQRLVLSYSTNQVCLGAPRGA